MWTFATRRSSSRGSSWNATSGSAPTRPSSPACGSGRGRAWAPEPSSPRTWPRGRWRSGCRPGLAVHAERPCEVCGARSARTMYDVDGWPIVRCEECGLVYVGRTLSREELIELYTHSYWEDAEATGYVGYGDVEREKRHHFGTLLDRLAPGPRPRDPPPGGRADGVFLDEAAGRGGGGGGG